MICRSVILFFSLLMGLQALSFAENHPLPPHQAFQLAVSFETAHELAVVWHTAPRYFLYAKRMKIELVPPHFSKITYPKSTWRDIGPGMHEKVYTGNVIVPILLTANTQPLVLNIHYQGCSQDGFCYPPQDRQFKVEVAKQLIVPMDQAPLPAVTQPKPTYSFLSLLTNQNQVDMLMKDQPFAVILFFFAVLGLLLTFTPCVLPMIPILTALILGQAHKPGSRKAFFLSLTYVLGMSVTYAAAGLFTAWLGRSLQVFLQQPIVIAVMSGLFVLLALSLFGVYDIRLPNRLQHRLTRWSNHHKSGTYLGVFMMGILATLVVSPCVTAPLIGVLLYISQTGDLILGTSALFVMGLGMGVPLILIGTSAGAWVPKTGPWMKIIKNGLGVLMLVMALWLVARAQVLPAMMPEVQDADSAFTVVHQLDTIQQQLSLAHSSHRPVLLDFYASWCADCVVMDRQVFGDRAVQQALSSFLLLRVDLSSNSAEDNRIMSYFHVIAPPTVLFVDNNGQEVESARVVGGVDAAHFIKHIENFFVSTCGQETAC
jgi:thiol:disulfide interchange protein DsbD